MLNFGLILNFLTFLTHGESSPQLHSEALNADEHIDNGLDAHTLGVVLLEALPARLTEGALDRVKPVTDKVIGQVLIDYPTVAIILCAVCAAPTTLLVLMLVDVRSEWLLKLAVQNAKVRLGLQELDHGQLDAWKSEKLFHTHIALTLLALLLFDLEKKALSKEITNYTHTHYSRLISIKSKF